MGQIGAMALLARVFFLKHKLKASEILEAKNGARNPRNRNFGPKIAILIPYFVILLPKVRFLIPNFEIKS